MPAQILVVDDEPNILTSVRTLLTASGYTVTTNMVTSVVSSNLVAASKGPGWANDYVQISATYTINTITPLFSFLGGYSHQGMNQYPIYVSAIVKNEPALLNFQHTNVYLDEYGPYQAPDYP